jgi:hypothetical protein
MPRDREIFHGVRTWLGRSAERLLARLRPRGWQTGCLSTVPFSPPSDIPVSVPPPVGWTWLPGLWEEFNQGGGPVPNGGPISVTHPAAKHVDRSHPAAADVPGGGTINAPWATIQYALNQLNSGGTLYIHRPNDPNPARVGLYEEHLLIDGRQGSPAQPFWVIAEFGVRVSNLNSTQPGLRVRNSAYWVLQNFELDGGGANARRNPATGQIDLVTGVEISHSLRGGRPPPPRPAPRAGR